MSKATKLVEVFFLGAALYVIKVAVTLLTLIVSSSIAAVFVAAALEFSSYQSGGAVPAIGYLASWGVSFILIFTSYVGARGAAQSKD